MILVIIENNMTQKKILIEGGAIILNIRKIGNGFLKPYKKFIQKKGECAMKKKIFFWGQGIKRLLIF